MDLPKEPDIIINGVPLSMGQAMTVRVSLQSMAMDLQENGLGDDEHGKRMVKLYLANIRAINVIIGSQ